jgi:hypothetical protein
MGSGLHGGADGSSEAERLQTVGDMLVRAYAHKSAGSVADVPTILAAHGQQSQKKAAAAAAAAAATAAAAAASSAAAATAVTEGGEGSGVAEDAVEMQTDDQPTDINLVATTGTPRSTLRAKRRREEEGQVPPAPDAARPRLASPPAVEEGEPTE